ncbi:hypothetical protein HAX54_038071 [Datura stramonium]|uniref:Uncharacterized protein n=1 Tax=Datura stramonium TaxID=4076 RepID=A0ABS8VMQ3_DATST|nr:hypothetical protein [Datura stramonium]
MMKMKGKGYLAQYGNASPFVKILVQSFIDNEIIFLAEPTVKVTAVKWNNPKLGYVKTNSNSSSWGNSGPSGGGGIIRDDNGKMIISAYATTLGEEIQQLY